MPRPVRRVLPGVAVHIVQRGNNRQDCFLQDADYLIYLATLRLLAERHSCRVHSYCLMTNHVHLLLTAADAQACTALMRDLGQRYVQAFNRRHARTGTLWEGRFRSCVVESAPYVLACYRYIELNPVRASMVDHPGGYLWSSYAVNAGLRRDALISPHAEYAALGLGDESRWTAYRALLDQSMDGSLLNAIRQATASGVPLVSESFKADVMAPLGYRIERGRPGPRAKMRRAAYAVE